MPSKYIAQGLLESWKKNQLSDTRTSLLSYLKINYQRRHVELCIRLGVKPCGFAEWLRKPISTIV